eukprot:5978563-Alexandrium_andersonii.AAC.1
MVGCSDVRNMPDALGETDLEVVVANVAMGSITALSPDDLTLPRGDFEARGWTAFGYRPQGGLP